MKKSSMSISSRMFILAGTGFRLVLLEASSASVSSIFSIYINIKVEDAQGHEALIEGLTDSIAGSFVYSIMILSYNICFLKQREVESERIEKMPEEHAAVNLLSNCARGST
ncbi:uncharacterized protein LOC133733959 [Rosa rugosa]|uniref:uncharacterized protein LOC133733959 n=1 Tax=Rosa rugosa TaxID=74645 RepID=UPI002B40E3C7|nr:uncharacterized protein LOC133733959 [Rosa rugosa]